MLMLWIIYIHLKYVWLDNKAIGIEHKGILIYAVL
jgi:hypothetical protein